jgi:hypothetical protein
MVLFVQWGGFPSTPYHDSGTISSSSLAMMTYFQFRSIPSWLICLIHCVDWLVKCVMGIGEVVRNCVRSPLIVVRSKFGDWARLFFFQIDLDISKKSLYFH